MSDHNASTQFEIDSPWNALVLGATGGIGSAYCRALAERKLNLILSGRNEQALERMAAELSSEFGIHTRVIAGDLNCREHCHRMAEVLRHNRHLQYFVNAAGTAQWGSFAQLDAESERKLFEVNLLSSIELLRAAVNAFLPRGSGKVVHISSAAAFYTVPYLASYCASKAAALSVIRAIIEELRGQSITIQALCPGFVKTPMFALAGANVESIPRFLWISPQRVVAQSLRSLERGSGVCVPGLLYQVFAQSSRLVPSWLSTRIAGRMFDPSSGNRKLTRGKP